MIRKGCGCVSVRLSLKARGLWVITLAGGSLEDAYGLSFRHYQALLF